jgi:hypothetical protein
MILKECFKIPASTERQSSTKSNYWYHALQLRQGHQVFLRNERYSHRLEKITMGLPKGRKLAALD